VSANFFVIEHPDLEFVAPFRRESVSLVIASITRAIHPRPCLVLSVKQRAVPRMPHPAAREREVPLALARGTLLEFSFDCWSDSMPIPKELMAILACPVCKKPLVLLPDETGLKCEACKRVYPIRDHIPVLLAEEATVFPE
jgi:uncharacterized protein YbaR (Trm112 family)